jgi:hypothetical protein
MSIWTDTKHKEWADLARRTEPFIDKLTGRNDIYVTVRPDLRPEDVQKEQHVPAGVFTPSLARIAFNPNHIFDKDVVTSVADVDPCAVRSQRQHPEFVGVAVHESSHGRHSNYSLPRLEGKIAHWVAMIEEPRSERWLIEEFPQYAVYVKSMVTNVLGGDKFFGGTMFDNQPEELQRRYQAGQLCFLIMARAEYGVYDWDELEESEKTLRDILGDDDYDTMNELWLDAIALKDDQVDEIIELAERVQKLIDPNNQIDEQPEQQGAEAPCGAYILVPMDDDSDDDSDDADGDSEGSGKGSGKSSSKRGRGNESEDEESEDSEGEGSDGKDSDDSEDSDGQGSGKGKDSEDQDSDDSDDSDGDNADGKDGEPKDADGVDAAKGKAALNGLIHDALRKELNKIAQDAKDEINQAGQDQGLKFNRNKAEEDAAHRKVVNKAKDGIAKAPSGGRSAGYSGYSWNHLTLNERVPDQADISRARAMETALGQAQYREVAKTTLRSVTPPGRLSMRGMVQREGQIAARQEITATPWSQIRRRIVENPPITLAIASDISGSMNAYQRAVGSFSWAFAHAIRRKQGKVGAVAWDSAVHEYIKPGLTMEKVPYYTDGGTSEGLPAAIFALDGLMNLSFGEGVRVLAVITDGQLPNDKEVQDRINLLHSYGVQILWILTDKRGSRPKNTTVAVLDSPEDFGKIVGKKVIELLANA